MIVAVIAVVVLAVVVVVQQVLFARALESARQERDRLNATVASLAGRIVPVPAPSDRKLVDAREATPPLPFGKVM